MADHTLIEWADATLNVWWGCTKVSDGCKFCYAEHLSDNRLDKGAWGPKGTRQEVKSWRSTLQKIGNRATKEGKRLRVFAQSMSDTFESPETMGGVGSENWKLVSQLQDDFLLESIFEYPQLDFLLLTKRPENVLHVLHRHDEPTDYSSGYQGSNFMFPSNIWLGTSVENQETADERIPHLLKVDSSVRFLSCEPLLGSVDLSEATGVPPYGSDEQFGAQDVIHWVIVGGESGPKARPMNVEWVRSLRDQCKTAGVAFFFKQWGEWIPADQLQYTDLDLTAADLAKLPYSAEHNAYRVGKKQAGRNLGGKEWSEFPEAQS